MTMLTAEWADPTAIASRVRKDLEAVRAWSDPEPPARRLARSNGELTAWELHQATHERGLQRRVDAIGL